MVKIKLVQVQILDLRFRLLNFEIFFELGLCAVQAAYDISQHLDFFRSCSNSFRFLLKVGVPGRCGQCVRAWRPPGYQSVQYVFTDGVVAPGREGRLQAEGPDSCWGPGLCPVGCSSPGDCRLAWSRASEPGPLGRKVGGCGPTPTMW